MENSTSPPPRKHQVRTKFLILPQFQLKLLGANLAILCAAALVTWLQVNSSFEELSAAAGSSGVEAEFYQRYLAFHARSMNISLLVGFVASVAVSTVLTLMISHKFSGPIVRIRGYFKELGADRIGPLPELRFRRGDVLGDIPPLVNTALTRIQGKARAGQDSDREAS